MSYRTVLEIEQDIAIHEELYNQLTAGNVLWYDSYEMEHEEDESHCWYKYMGSVVYVERGQYNPMARDVTVFGNTVPLTYPPTVTVRRLRKSSYILEWNAKSHKLNIELMNTGWYWSEARAMEPTPPEGMIWE